MESYEIIWKSVLKELEIKLSSITYSTYIKGLKPIDLNDKTLVLMTEAQLKADFITRDTLKSKILDAFKKTKTDINDIEVFVGTKVEDYKSLRVETANDPKIESLPIDPNYTFDNFVVGNSNRYLYAAAKAVAENPGNTYNPLFIYGASGLGKTHIMHSIANEIQKTMPTKKIVYSTCEKFTTELIANIRSGKAYSQEGVEFKNKY